MLTKSYPCPFGPMICGGIYPTPIKRLKNEIWLEIEGKLWKIWLSSPICKIVISFKKFKNQLTELSGEETIDGILFASC